MKDQNKNAYKTKHYSNIPYLNATLHSPTATTTTEWPLCDRQPRSGSLS